MTSFSDFDVTFEFDLKLSGSSGSCLDIFTYDVKEINAFQLRACKLSGYNEFSMYAIYSTTSKSVSFKLEDNVWYHLAMTWDRNAKLLQVYI